VIDNKRRQQPLNRLTYSDKVPRKCGIRDGDRTHSSNPALQDRNHTAAGSKHVPEPNSVHLGCTVVRQYQSSAIRFVAPIVSAGMTALSVEMTAIFSATNALAACTICSVLSTLVLAAAKGISSISDTCLQAAACKHDVRTCRFAYLGKQSRVADIADDQIMRDRTILAKVQCEILQPRLGKIQER
jgi:hypothetical protein